MPKITKRWLDSLKPPAKDTVWWDDREKGFGVRATPGGAISFIVQYRNAQGRSRRLTIGSYGPYTPEAARAEAKELLRLAQRSRNGLDEDPAELKRKERNAITFIQLAENYMADAKAGLILGRKGKPKKASTVKVDEYRIKHLKDHFAHKPVKNINRLDCEACLNWLVSGNHGAARTMGLLGSLFSYAIRGGYIATNPAHGIKKPADGMREFNLDDESYRALGKAIEAAVERAERWQGIAAIRLLALTGCRRGEILKLKWTEVDFKGRCLRLGDTKTGSSVRPLGEATLTLLKSLRPRPGQFESAYVLPGIWDQREPFNGLGGTDGGAWKRIVGDAYTAHGLRHAYASVAGELGYSELTIAALLGHSRSTVTSRYVKLDSVLLAAADRVAGHIWAAMKGEVAKGEVVEFPRSA